MVCLTIVLFCAQISRLVSLQSYLDGDADEPKASLHSSGADLSVFTAGEGICSKIIVRSSGLLPDCIRTFQNPDCQLVSSCSPSTQSIDLANPSQFGCNCSTAVPSELLDTRTGACHVI